MKGTFEKHVGFPDGAPAGVNWSKEMFVHPVELFEKRNLRPYVLVLSLSWMVLIILAIGIALMKQGDNVFSDYQNMDAWDWLFILSLSFGIMVLIFDGHFVKGILISMIRSRPNRLFDPDWKCLYVQIEDANTFNKIKLTTNDFGLLQVHSNFLELEMMNHRARFLANDISISIHSPSALAHGVRITSDTGQWPWSVVLVAPLQNWNILLGADQALSSRWLLKRIEEGLAIGS